LKAKPVTGLPSLRASVSTATTEVVISEKSMLEFRIFDAIGMAHSRISRIRIALAYLIKNFDPSLCHARDWELITFERAVRTGWLAGVHWRRCEIEH
jgi:hypothetical protein